MSKVFLHTNSIGRVDGIMSDAFFAPPDGWVQVDEGDGDRYMHAQGNYLPKPLMDEQGRYRYKLVEGVVAERTTEELESDVPPHPTPSDIEQINAENVLLKAQVQALSDRGEFMEDCIAEMATQVYQ